MSKSWNKRNRASGPSRNFVV